MVYKPLFYSQGSLEVLNTCCSPLKVIFETYIRHAVIDVSLVCGLRSLHTQMFYYKSGKSEKDGVNSLSKHQFRKDSLEQYKSDAIDISAWVKGHTSYKIHDMCFIAGELHAIARYLLQKGEIKHKLRWGGNWNMNGEIITDQKFDDLCHYEIYEL